MATLSSRGSFLATTSTTWANTSNSADGTVGTNPATYATYVDATRSSSGSITIGNYAFGGVTYGSTISSLTAAIRHIETSTTIINSVTVQLRNIAGTAISAAVSATLNTSAHTDTLTLPTPTALDVVDGLQVLVTITRSNSRTSTTFSLDQVDLTVTYTNPNAPPTVVLANPANTATSVSATPALSFTGTDPQADTIEYNVQVDKVNTFNSQPGSLFVDTGAGIKVWYGVAVNSTNGDVFGCSNNGSIWKQTAGTGSFVDTGAGAKIWIGVAVNSTNGDVFASVNNGSIWKQTAGTGSFVDTGAGTNTWYGVAVNSTNGDVFASVNNGSIWKQTAGTGLFVDTGAGTNTWTGVAVNSTSGEVFGCAVSGSIWKQASIPPIDALSTTNAGFTAGHPFASGAQQTYTVQSALTASTQYFWRARAIDPSGSNTYGAWATTRSFTTAILGSPPTVTLGSPADTAMVVSTTPALTFTGTDADSNTVEYNVQVDTINTFGVNTYYFDASGAAATDPNAVWTNATNAFDGSTSTFASVTTSGSTSTNYLTAAGTNAPTTGITISQLRARVYADTQADIGFPIANAAIYTNNLAELLGTPTKSGVAGYGSYVVLSTPSGGWTWQKIKDLIVKIYSTSGTVIWTKMFKVEVEVTSTPLINALSTTDAGFTAGHPFASGVGNTYTVQNGQDVMIDSFSEANYDSDGYTLGQGVTFNTDFGQSFTGNGLSVTSCKFYLKKVGSPTFNLTAKIYALTGTPGTNATPTGSVLATSNSVTASSLATSHGLITFTFSTPYTPVNATDYFILVSPSGYTGTSDYVVIGANATSPADAGANGCQYKTTFSMWGSLTSDFPFYLYHATNNDSLTALTQYFWRARGIDPLGSNTYGAWSATRSFTVSTGIKVWNGSTWGYKPAKVWNGTAWAVKPLKVWNGTAWVIKG